MEQVVAGIAKNYQIRELGFDCVDCHFPSRGAVIGLIKDLRSLLFPRYFSDDLVGGGTAGFVDPALFIFLPWILYFIGFHGAPGEIRAGVGAERGFIHFVPQLAGN